MEFEKVKEILIDIKRNYDEIDYEVIRKIDTVLQELDRLQKENDLAKKALIANSYEADERNNLLVKIQELQKENEKLKEIDLTTVHIKGVCDEKERWRNKIRELIEELNKLLPDIDYRDIKDKQEREYYKKEYHKVFAQINVLENLLKEE